MSNGTLGVERTVHTYILTSKMERYILTNIIAVIVSKLSKIVRTLEVKYRGKVFGLQYNKGLRRIGGGDQADTFNLIQNRQNISVYLKVLIDEEEQWRIAQGSK